MTTDKNSNKEKQPQPGEEREDLQSFCGCLVIDDCGCYEDVCGIDASDKFEEEGTPCRCVNFR